MATSNSPQTGIYTDQIGPGRSATMHFDEDGHLDLTSGSIQLPGSLANGYLSLGSALFSARTLASAENIASGSTAPTAFFGGLLMPDGVSPAIKMNSTIDHVLVLQWTSAQVGAIITPPVALPDDLSTADGLTIELLGESIGTGTASDAKAAFTVLPSFGVATTSGTGTTHADFSSTPSWQSIAVASGSITTGQLTVQLTPEAHAARAISLFDMRVRYTKKTS